MIRLILGIILGVVTMVFAIQNTETVTYVFFAWTLSAPRWLILIAVFAFGLFTGWLVSGLRRIGRKR